MAAAACPFCGEAIGYDRRFYRSPEHGLCHAVCLEDHIDTPPDSVVPE
jgi:hypothetical protein